MTTNQGVGGSNPSWVTRENPLNIGLADFLCAFTIGFTGTGPCALRLERNRPCGPGEGWMDERLDLRGFQQLASREGWFAAKRLVSSMLKVQGPAPVLHWPYSDQRRSRRTSTLNSNKKSRPEPAFFISTSRDYRRRSFSWISGIRCCGRYPSAAGPYPGGGWLPGGCSWTRGCCGRPYAPFPEDPGVPR